MPRCTFCGIQIPKGTGKIYVYSSGKIANFCKSKCEKNLLKLKRKPLNIRWTDAYRKEHKKETKEEKEEKKTAVKAEPKAAEVKKVKEEKTTTAPATEETQKE